jgi:phosphatidylserine decarboxylase
MTTSAQEALTKLPRHRGWRAVENDLDWLAVQGTCESVVKIAFFLIKSLFVSPRLAVLPQYLLPKKLLTALAGVFARREAGKLTTAAIRWFVKRYAVNLSEAAFSDVRDYRSFNDFFTRELKPGSREMAASDFICPVDGAISQFGQIAQDLIVQAKGHQYTVESLLAGHRQSAMQYENGWFSTIYLSPRDYHRVHMPCDGRLEAMTYVPGTLFSVNPLTASSVPRLFARNERVICEFSTAFGPMTLVLVGATIVGSVATVWHGTVNPPRGRKIRRWTYESHGAPIVLRKGDEMGRFMLGSTVVLLMPRPEAHEMNFNPSWQPGGAVQLGHAMASYAPLEKETGCSVDNSSAANLSCTETEPTPASEIRHNAEDSTQLESDMPEQAQLADTDLSADALQQSTAEPASTAGHGRSQ